jgi:hypothetical protein
MGAVAPWWLPFALNSLITGMACGFLAHLVRRFSHRIVLGATLCAYAMLAGLSLVFWLTSLPDDLMDLMGSRPTWAVVTTTLDVVTFLIGLTAGTILMNKLSHRRQELAFPALKQNPGNSDLGT